MKNDKWEKTFSDNFRPDFWLGLLQRLEVYRQDVILQLLPSTGGVLVDLACGDGDLLIKVNNFKKLIGFDIAKNRILSATKKFKNFPKDKILLKTVDLDNGIPLKDSSVDVIVCEASLSYFEDVEFVLSEVYRILKKKGIFIVQVPNYAFLPRRIELLLGRLPKTSAFNGFGDGGAKRYFTYSELKKILEKNKLKVVIQTNSGVLPGIRKLRPELLAGDIILKAVKR